MRRSHILNGLRRSAPILLWLPEYSLEKALGDVIAGVTVGLTLIPQSVAYAALAGLEPQYGLYSSLCGGFIYACFGTVKDLNIAPTALVSLLTYSYTKDLASPAAAIFLCFATGVLQLLFGALRLGFLVDLVSAPVVSGFTSAGAVTIAASQVKNMLGLRFRAESFVEVVYHACANIASTHLGDAALSLACCTLLIGLREMRRWAQAPSAPNARRSRVAIWFASVGRNALVVVATSACAYLLRGDLFTLTNAVPDGLPPFAPPFKPEDVIEHVRQLRAGILIVALVAILSNMAIAKAFSTGKILNASHEMCTLGACNIVGSFCGSFPVNASFSRAALNNASGARTQFGGIYTGIMVILSLTFLTKYFVFIPKAALASIIFCAVIYMVEVDMVIKLWRTSKPDLIPLSATFLWSLADSIERGILVGVLADVLLIVWWNARPTIEDENISSESAKRIQLSLAGSITFMSAESLRNKVNRILHKCHDTVVISADSDGKRLLIVFNCEKLQRIDYSAAKALGALLADLADDSDKKSKDIIFVNLDKKLQDKLERIIGSKLTCADRNGLEEILRDERDNSQITATTPC